jgi:hypothetical protein
VGFAGGLVHRSGTGELAQGVVRLAPVCAC